MNNLRIDKELEEQYVDASVALFMDQYAQVLSQKLDQEMENDKEYADLVYPESLDQRCRKLIQDEHKRMRRKKRVVTVKKVLNRAAIILVALLALSSVLFMTVDAIRIPIMNFFVEKQSDSWHITGSSQNTAKVESQGTSTFGFTNSYANRMPSEYSVVQIIFDTHTDFFGVFENSLGQEVRLFINPAESNIYIDSENVDTAEYILVLDYEGVLISEGEYCRVVWLQNDVLITIISKNMDNQSAIALAELISER